MASSAYFICGAAAGLARGYAYAVEQLVPGGHKLTRLIGFETTQQGRDDDVIASTTRDAPAGPSGARDAASWLTEINVRPLNAQYEAGGAAAGSRAGRGRRGDAHDALTIATTNRYTYALGQAGAGVAGSPHGSAPVTPRSEATSDSTMAALRRKKRLFKGLRQKGDKANQMVR
ncbi:hypothetical protein MNEG_9900 [Monoraphidium neglectum]|uniref:Uncharacterized protein n=1 Tax=Monoraphidium neglectum TaxID=145388 RepID=A0A0D2M3A0_9CHLO|nr:hypothetical protein MNEG_9900 [Monoraphidium neglectum]KIY98059.1 hypothetical protein MNEG_9900 [Monoraphidium neglectum]|eukprot:XP_013897079.1 hypothetical protein MNEG_9900 [Monoraphidium neglectum]